MELRYTRQQTARGSRPDATVGDTWYLLKNVSQLRLTYQIRLLTFGAMQSRARLDDLFQGGAESPAPKAVRCEGW